jgi:hypothetical protein
MESSSQTCILYHVYYSFSLTIPLKNKNIKDYINEEVIASRCLIPPYMSGNYKPVDFKTTSSEWKDALLRIIPASVIPLMVCPEAILALDTLTHACSVALQWFVTEYQLVTMDK